MKLFITWSGPTSKAIATALRNWIPIMIQSVEPFMSETDIDKGAQWDQVMSLQLETSYAGIVCLTPDNLNAPWLLFEAGALSKSTRGSESRVVTYLHNLTPAEVRPPLSRFQHTLADKQDTRRLMFDLRKLANSPGLTEDGLGKLFDTMWPQFEAQIREAPPSDTRPRRDQGEMIEEMLNLVRNLDRRMSAVFPPELNLGQAPLTAAGVLARRFSDRAEAKEAFRSRTGRTDEPGVGMHPPSK
jgi:hypothetical protein